MGEHLHAAEVLARAQGDQYELARIATFTVIQCLNSRDYAEAMRFGQETLGIARTLGDRSLEPRARRQRTLDTVKRVLTRESHAQLVLLVSEDLHWIDSETQVLLDSLVESLPAVRILLLVNYRPEYGHSWGSRTYYSQLRLDPLPAASAEALLTGLLGAHPTLETIKHLLAQRTQGNPFFLEETVRSLVESGVLTEERGAHRLARPFNAAQVPPAVQTVLAARIDHLPRSDHHLFAA